MSEQITCKRGFYEFFIPMGTFDSFPMLRSRDWQKLEEHLEFSLSGSQPYRTAPVRKIHATRLLPSRRPMRATDRLLSKRCRHMAGSPVLRKKEKGPRLGKPRAQVAAIEVWVFGGGEQPLKRIVFVLLNPRSPPPRTSKRYTVFAGVSNPRGGFFSPPIFSG